MLGGRLGLSTDSEARPDSQISDLNAAWSKSIHAGSLMWKLLQLRQGSAEAREYSSTIVAT